MIDHWGIVFDSFFKEFFMTFLPAMNVIIRKVLKFRQPFFYIYALLIIVLLLTPRIKNSKIRSSVSSIAYTPLPSPWILHRWVVNQLTCKISFALPPIQEKIFRQKACNNHPTTIMHKASFIEFSHSCINYWKACFSLFPFCQGNIIIFPLQIIELFLVGFAFQNPRVVICDVSIKLPPMKFIDNVVLKTKFLQGSLINLSDWNCCEM